MATIEFKLPDIGEGVAEGEITSWKVKPGDAVTEDQIMVEVMTDKATVEIGSPVTGKVVELKAGEGQTVPVGGVIVVLSSEGPAPKIAGHGGHAAPAAAPKAPAARPPAQPAAATPVAKAAAPTRVAIPPAPARATTPLAPAAPRAPAPAASAPREEIDFCLPDIGEGVAEGEITRWMVAEGDAVREDQPMLEVMTDKATVEIGSPVDGVVLRLLHAAGTTVPVGEVLLVLGASQVPVRAGAGHAAHAAKAAAKEVPPDVVAPGALATASRASTLADTGLPSRADGTRRVRAAPAVRRLAREVGVDLSRVQGSGPAGRVTVADLRAAQVAASRGPTAAPAAVRTGASAALPVAAAGTSRTPATAPAAAPAPTQAQATRPAAAPTPAARAGDERLPLRGLRKRIAAQMRLSKSTAAHFAYIEEIDVTELVRLRGTGKAAAEARGVKLTYLPFLIKAACAGLRRFPLLNASLDETAGEIILHGEIHLGVAVDTEAGLIVPVVRNADSKSLLDLGREIQELAERARAGKTRPEDVGGGTFTMTNAGNIGGLLATPIINVPEVAILGVHAIRRRPWVVDEQIVIRDIMYLSLSLDHRVVDGAVGARFMNVVKELLENPALMLLEG